MFFYEVESCRMLGSAVFIMRPTRKKKHFNTKPACPTEHILRSVLWERGVRQDRGNIGLREQVGHLLQLGRCRLNIAQLPELEQSFL